MVRVELAEEAGVGDEIPPAPADGGGAREGGGLRREAEEDLPEHVVVVRQGRGRRDAAPAASAGRSSASLLARVDLGMEPRAAAAGHCGALLHRLVWIWGWRRLEDTEPESEVKEALSRAPAACSDSESVLVTKLPVSERVELKS